MKKYTRGNILAKRTKTKGQSTFEYLIVAAALVTALLTPLPAFNDRNVVEVLIDAIKQEYRAYKYAHSVNTLPLP